MLSVERPKDPRRVAGGLRGARTRWGPRRVVRLDGLPPDVANVIRQLVAAAEAAANEKASPAIGAPGEATPTEGISRAQRSAT